MIEGHSIYITSEPFCLLICALVFGRLLFKILNDIDNSD